MRWPFKILGALIVFGFFMALFQTCSGIPSFQSYKDKAQAAKIAAESVALDAKGKLIKNKHPDWSNANCNYVGNKIIAIGMTSDQVIASLGKPDHTNVTTTQSGTHEQWVYGKYAPMYAYLQDGVVISFQYTK